MNKKEIANSTLKVTASENLDVSKDLESEQTKSISELLNEEEKNKQTS
jgi:hypothetical protein